MRIAILSNPKAGKGRGAAVAAELAHAASGEGHTIRSIDVIGGVGGPEAVQGAIEWCEGVAIVGGDGTLHHTLPHLVSHPRPIYHAAMGTENLFAREFGHAPRAELFLRALRQKTTRRIDLAEMTFPGSSDQRVLFSIMASMGPDASIVHRLASRRTGPIHHVSYLAPAFAELVSPRIPRLWIRADGKDLVEGRQGMVLIANMRHYAVRLNPASRADAGDGLLDVLFVPGSNLISVAASMVACRLGIRGGARVARARRLEVEIAPSDTMRPQADGEAVVPRGRGDLGGFTEARPRAVAQVLPGALEVFVLQ